MVNEYKEVAPTIYGLLYQTYMQYTWIHYDPHLYNVVYDAPLEFRTRTLIQGDKLLYIVKGKRAPG